MRFHSQRCSVETMASLLCRSSHWSAGRRGKVWQPDIRANSVQDRQRVLLVLAHQGAAQRILGFAVYCQMAVGADRHLEQIIFELRQLPGSRAWSRGFSVTSTGTLASV